MAFPVCWSGIRSIFKRLDSCLVQHRDAFGVAVAKFRDETTKLAFVMVLFQSRVSLGIIRLQAQEFIGCFPHAGSESGDFLAPFSPCLPGLLTRNEKTFVISANRSLEGKFCFHLLLPQTSRCTPCTNPIKLRVCWNLLTEWLLRKVQCQYETSPQRFVRPCSFYKLSFPWSEVAHG